LVSLIHQYPQEGVDRVGVDNELGMGKVVGHLAGLGHQKVGFFGVHSDVTWARSRYGAYVEALMSQGLELNADWIVSVAEQDALDEGMIDAAAYVPKIKALISAGVTAMVCSGDLLCYGLLDALMKEGVRVPDDLSLSGVHVQSRQPGLPALTSVMLSSEELGATALRRMVRRLEFPEETCRTILLPCELVVGSSTGVLR
jgi:LacI family transcriptional regulator